MSPATHGQSYIFLETMEILMKKHSFWTAELAARKGSPRMLPVRSEKLSWELTENVGIPYVSCLRGLASAEHGWEAGSSTIDILHLSGNH